MNGSLQTNAECLVYNHEKLEDSIWIFAIWHCLLLNEISYLSLSSLLYYHFRSKKLSEAGNININYNREAAVDCDGYVEFHGRGWWLINVFAIPTDLLCKNNAKAIEQIGFYFLLFQKKML